MGTSFIPLYAIIAVLIIAFLFASLPQVNHKTRYRVLYSIAIIMLLAVIPISEYMARDTQNSNNNYLFVLIFDIAVGYFCMYIAALLKFNVLKQKNQALENALTEKQQEFMYFVCFDFFNMEKKRSDIVSFLYKFSARFSCWRKCFG